MMEIQEEKRQVILYLNKNLYPPELVLQALGDFNKVCEGSLNEEKLILKPKGEMDLTYLGCEFSNYLIGLLNGGKKE